MLPARTLQLAVHLAKNRPRFFELEGLEPSLRHEFRCPLRQRPTHLLTPLLDQLPFDHTWKWAPARSWP